MTITRDDLQRLLRLLDLTEAQEIDCDEFLDRVAEFAERAELSPATSPEDARLIRHLKICPECTEEFDALCAVLRTFHTDENDEASRKNDSKG